jgi:hypothetical protein
MDLPTWDEAIYMGSGAIFLHKGVLGPVDISPVYCALYSVFISAAGRIGSIFVAQYIVKTFVSLALFLFLSVRLRSRLLASLLTMIWIASNSNVHAQILPNYVALGLFLLALVCMEKHRVLALLLLCLCALTRLEYAFLLFAFAAYFVWQLVRQKAAKKPLVKGNSVATGFSMWELASASLLVIVMGYVALHISSFSMGGRHAWFSFSEGYAEQAVREGRFHFDPDLNNNIVMQTDFPGASSFRQALAVNPRALMKSVAKHIPLAVEEIVVVVAFPYRGAVLLLALYGVLGGLIVALLWKAYVGGKFTKTLYAAFRKEKLPFYATVITFMSLYPVLLVYPYQRLVMSMAPFILFWLGLVCQEALDVANLRHFGTRALVVLNVLFVCFILVSPRAYSIREPSRPVLAEVTDLSQLWPNRPTKLLGIGSTWIADYLGADKVVPIEPLGTVGPDTGTNVGRGNMRILLKQYDPDVVLVNSGLLASPNFDASTLSALDSAHWKRCSIGSDSFYFKTGTVDTRLPCFTT